MNERKVIRATSSLNEQTDSLVAAFEIGEPYLEPQIVEYGMQVLTRADVRRSLSSDHVVIGLFGATGSGKSSLFNRLAGSDMARTGVTRPTTKKTVAAIWGAEGAAELLDWLEIDERHVVGAESAPSVLTQSLKSGQGLILLDLPDMDSTAVEHHAISERLTSQVDFMIWVLDPQKYADASIHHGYLTDMTNYQGHMLVVLNQIDKIAEDERAQVKESLISILSAEGLSTPTVITASARSGEGLKELSEVIRKVCTNKALATRKVKTDVDEVIRILASELLVVKARVPTKLDQSQLEQAIAHANGTHVIADAVEHSYRLRASASTGWPLTTWLVQLKSDPLKRMNLGRNRKNPELSATSRGPLSIAETSAIHLGINKYLDDATEDLPARWREPLATEVATQTEQLEQNVDTAIASTDLGMDKRSWWWPMGKFLQWASLLIGLVGALWLGGLAIAGYLQFQLPPAPKVEGIAIPTLMLAAGILLGIVLGLLGSFLNRMVAKIKGKRAQRNLERSVSQVVRRLIVEPVEMHLDKYNSYAALVDKAAQKAD
ncbi:GTPase [Glutamicibacter sp.]|uniref:GTPase n=1 Tax=Glutamicibacter sp. TaxID=1931995 RepID=UPI0028BE2BED|nr:GTPase [Glutamicibacter sp.]